MELNLAGFRLRNWREGDEEPLARHANNPNVSRYLRDRFPFPYTLTDARAYIARGKGLPDAQALTIEVDGESCGGIGLHPQDDVYRHSAEIGYWLGEEYWGRGIMTSAAAAITKFGFEDLGLARIFASVFEPNLASCRVLEKVGYRLEGRRRKAVLKNGALLDDLLYGILREDVRPSPAVR